MRRRPEGAAIALLKQLQIDAPPVDVESVAEQLGVRVVRDTLEEEVSALLYRRGASSLILVSDAHSETRQRFSIAHEIGHFVLHTDPVFVERPAPQVRFRNAASSLGYDPKEIDANAFAAALLMPAEWILDSVERRLASRKPPSEARLVSALAREFDVSPEAACIRLVNLGVIGTL